jgi:hypothetical protein
MATIVLYREREAPVNEYPDRIVSPTKPQACCGFSMAAIGQPWVEGRASLQYRRCIRCGFTVRMILETRPDPAPLRSVRAAFGPLFGGRGRAGNGLSDADGNPEATTAPTGRQDKALDTSCRSRY